MREVLIAVDFVSSSLSLSDLQRISGCAASDGSFDRENTGPGGKVRGHSRLRVSSDDRSVDIAGQVKAIAAKLQRVGNGAENDICVSLDVALLASTAMASLEIPTALLDELPLRPSSIAITCYLCSDDDPQ